MRKLTIALLLVISILLIYCGYLYYTDQIDEELELTPTWSPDTDGQESLPTNLATPDRSEHLVCQEVPIRLNPDQNGSIVGNLSAGERIIVLQLSDNAVRIETLTGITGWIDKDLVNESCN